MRGINVTQEQMAAASRFIEGQLLCSKPDFDQTVAHRYEDLVRLVAWYGAIRYRAAMDGIGSEDKPGVTEEVRK